MDRVASIVSSQRKKSQHQNLISLRRGKPARCELPVCRKATARSRTAKTRKASALHAAASCPLLPAVPGLSGLGLENAERLGQLIVRGGYRFYRGLRLVQVFFGQVLIDALRHHDIRSYRCILDCFARR
jgi:hypothetical protein